MKVNAAIQTLWIGKELSELENLCISSYIKNGYDFHLYAYDEISNVPEDCIILDANSILDESEVFCYNVGQGKGSFSAFSNLFRYKLLFEEGGVWTDTDVISISGKSVPLDQSSISSRKAGMVAVNQFSPSVE